jgi:hypothetical protein
MVVESKIQPNLHLLSRLVFVAATISVILTVTNGGWLPRTWAIPLVPILILLFLIIVTVHIALDNLAVKLSYSIKSVILFALYNLAATAGVFSVLLSLKLEKIINPGWGFVFIPVFHALAIYLGFAVFIVEGLWNHSENMKRQAVFLVLWFFAMVLTTVLFVLHKEISVPDSVGLVLAPMLSLGIVHLGYWVSEAIEMKKYGKSQRFKTLGLEMIWISNVLSVLVITCMKYTICKNLPGISAFIPSFAIFSYIFIQRERYYTSIDKKGFQEIETN